MGDGRATTAQQARNMVKSLATARALTRGDTAARAEDYRAVEAERPDLARLSLRCGW